MKLFLSQKNSIASEQEVAMDVPGIIRKLLFFLLIMTLFASLFAPALSAYNKKQYGRAIRFKICLKCDLYKAKFSGVDLSNADFSGSNLILASFQKATLYQATFEGANLSGANFSGALWINGMICQEESYGKCIFSEEK